jgi:cellulose biosynthesis protein BcsQ
VVVGDIIEFGKKGKKKEKKRKQKKVRGGTPDAPPPARKIPISPDSVPSSYVPGLGPVSGRQPVARPAYSQSVVQRPEFAMPFPLIKQEEEEDYASIVVFGHEKSSGKSISANALFWYLRLNGKKVLFIDFDNVVSGKLSDLLRQNRLFYVSDSEGNTIVYPERFAEPGDVYDPLPHISGNNSGTLLASSVRNLEDAIDKAIHSISLPDDGLEQFFTERINSGPSKYILEYAKEVEPIIRDQIINPNKKVSSVYRYFDVVNAHLADSLKRYYTYDDIFNIGLEPTGSIGDGDIIFSDHTSLESVRLKYENKFGEGLRHVKKVLSTLASEDYGYDYIIIDLKIDLTDPMAAAAILKAKHLISPVLYEDGGVDRAKGTDKKFQEFLKYQKRASGLDSSRGIVSFFFNQYRPVVFGDPEEVLGLDELGRMDYIEGKSSLDFYEARKLIHDASVWFYNIIHQKCSMGLPVPIAEGMYEDQLDYVLEWANKQNYYIDDDEDLLVQTRHGFSHRDIDCANCLKFVESVAATYNLGDLYRSILTERGEV